MKKHHPQMDQVKQEKITTILLKKIRENRKAFKISLVVVVAIIIGGIGLMGFRSAHSSSETKISLEDKTINSLRFKNATMDNKKLIVEVENISSSEYTFKTIDVIYKDSNDNTVTTVNGYIGNSLASGEVKRLVVETDEDLSGATTVTYKINR